MKKTFLSVLFLASMTAFISCKKETTTTTSEAKETEVITEDSAIYKIDMDNSVIDWKGSNPGETHTGTIKFMDGEAMVNNGKIEGGKFVFDMNSIVVTDLKADQGKEKLEMHLKGTGEKEKEDHFFNVGKFPKGSFEITKVTEENGKNMIEGNLTLKDISKSIQFPATITSDENGITLVSDSFTINRTEWNINYASKSVFDNLKDKFINDEIELTVHVKLRK